MSQEIKQKTPTNTEQHTTERTRTSMNWKNTESESLMDGLNILGNS